MAWISVHDHVIGGKLRELSKVLGCSQKESLGILVSLWIWGINNADKTGKLKSCDRNDVAEVLSIGLSENLNPREIVAGLIKQRWIDEEEEEDGTLYLHDWDVWQEQWYKFLSNKEYDAKRKKAARERQKAESQMEQKIEQPKSGEVNSPPETPPDSPADSPPDKSPNKKSSPYTKSYEEFWKVYPRKIGKGEAYKKYKARLNDGFSNDELIEAAKNYAQECLRMNTEDTYIKHAKTFLSENTPFMDYLPKKGISQDECGPKKVQNMQKSTVKGNRFHNFEQRDTDYDSIVLAQVKGWIDAEKEE